MTKANKKILIRGIILSLIVIVIVYFLNEVARVSVYNNRYQTVNYFYSLPENETDILIVGNSHAQEGINANLVSDILDANVFNFSFSQLQTPSAYYFLKEAFKKQSPKIVMLEAYTLIQQYQGGSEFIPLNLSKVKFYNMLDEERNFINCFFPIASNHNFWARSNPLKSMRRNFNAGKTAPVPVSNFRIMSDLAVTRHEIYDSEKRIKNLFEYRLSNLEEIQNLCDKNGAELVVFMLPLYKTLVDRIDYDGDYYNTISNFCDEHNIMYIDFNKLGDTDWTHKYYREQDYTHNTHLNVYGQTLMSTQLAQKISEISEYNINEYEQSEILITDFFNSVQNENSLLIVDDCPNPINTDLNFETSQYLESLGIDTSHANKEDGQPLVYFLEDSSILIDYILPESFDYAGHGVSLYEITPSGDILRTFITRWDYFDTGFIR